MSRPELTIEQRELAETLAKASDRPVQELEAVLREILEKQWRLDPPGDSGDADGVGHHVADAANDATQLLRIWSDRQLWVDPAHPRRRIPAAKVYEALGRSLAHLGLPMIAQEVFAEGLGVYKDNAALRFGRCLALARGGFTEEANRELRDMYERGHRHSETVALLARTFKDLGTIAIDPADRQTYLEQASYYYRLAFEESHDYYPGINLATVGWLLGNRDFARNQAAFVENACRMRLPLTPLATQERFWLLATLGEAALIQGGKAQAEDWYGQAGRLGSRWLGDLQSSRRNAEFILRASAPPGDPAWIQKLLRIPNVAVFSGHMVDKINRNVPRFPAKLVPAATEAIRKKLRDQDIRVGFAQAASGGDLIFLEAILEADPELHREVTVVLPYDREQFLHDSVTPVPEMHWRARFEAILAHATQVIQVSRERFDNPVPSIDYANQVMFGLALQKAQELQTHVVPIVLWDGLPGDGPGGTASCVERWRALKLEPQIIDLTALRRQTFPDDPEPIRPPTPPMPPAPAIPVKSMLFADAVHFSSLTESQVPKFVQHFLGGIGELLRQFKDGEVTRNTWGDGLYLVFPSVRSAGIFALTMCEFVTRTRWAEKGLPPTLNLRIALHAGPVYRCKDPVTGLESYTGTHVSRAARIEPITPPGQVYASDSFAALAAAEGVTEFTCDYVKLTAMPKGFGTYPTYLVRCAKSN